MNRRCLDNVSLNFKFIVQISNTHFGIIFAHVKVQTKVAQGQVTRSRQVTAPHILNASHSYTDWAIALKLSSVDMSNSMYKMAISEFGYQWPKVVPILRPLHYPELEDAKYALACF